MHIETEAMVCTVLPHGEHGAVVRFLTPAGLLAGYVAGAKSRRLRPVLVPGNVVRARIVGRNETQLARATVELERSRAGLAHAAAALATAEWLTGLAAAILPEGQPYPKLYATLGSVLDLAELQDDPVVTLAALARFEMVLLADLGFGLDLTRCAAGGQTSDLAFVSPKSGRAVSAEAGQPYADRLFRLPHFLIEAGPAAAADVADALAITRHFIVRDLLTGRRAETLLAARDRAVR